jgi:hypothetical protein
MRVNIYAEELTDRVEIISKEINGQTFTGLRIYLELPVTIGGKEGKHRSENGPVVFPPVSGVAAQIAGPFMHGPGDDDSSAVTFWGKRDLREVLKKALQMLDEHYAGKRAELPEDPGPPFPGEPRAVVADLPEGWMAGPSGVWTYKNGAMVQRVHSIHARTLTDENWVYACFPPGTLFKQRESGSAVAEVKDFAEALQVAQNGLPAGWRKHDERNWVHDNGAAVRWCESLRTPAINFEPGYSAFPPGAFSSPTGVGAITTELKSFLLALQIAEGRHDL